MHVINLFKKHKLIPKINDKLKETPYQTSNDSFLKSYSNTNSICVLHNQICELFGENVYIVKYVKYIDDIITTKNTNSLIPVACYDIMYSRNIENIKTMQEIKLKIDCYNYHNNYYICPLQKLLHIIDDSITKSIELSENKP